MAGQISPRLFPGLIVSPIDSETHLYLLALGKALALSALCLGGFALRLHLLSAYPFREDEAMYGVWALHLWRVDPLALTAWPDKPPLFLWLLGGVFQLFGPSEAAARLLNIAADTVTIAVVAATGRVLWNRQAGLFAAAAYTLNPFAISFAPTAYTDPTLVLWGMLAFYSALTRRVFWAGLFLAAAIATKQQGVLYLPLVIGVLFLTTKVQRRNVDDGQRTADGSTRHSQSTIFSFLLGFFLLFLPILLWDASRWAVAPSPWDLSVRNYAPFALLPPKEWVARAAQWGQVAWNLAGSWWVGGLVAMGIGYWAVTTRRHLSNIRYSTAVILLWTLGFVFLHIATNVQIWDRYLLPLAPVLALALGWSGARLAGVKRQGWPIALALSLILLPPALTAAQGGLPVGGDHGDYVGLSESIDWLRTHAPASSIVYHRDVSWQLHFAFFAATPGQPDVSDFELRWFPNAVYLADNAAKTPERRKFLVEPVWATVDSAAQRLQQRSIGWQIRLHTEKFTVYELTNPPVVPCAWCLCVDQYRQTSRFAAVPFQEAATTTPLPPPFCGRFPEGPQH